MVMVPARSANLSVVVDLVVHDPDFVVDLVTVVEIGPVGESLADTVTVRDPVHPRWLQLIRVIWEDGTTTERSSPIRAVPLEAHPNSSERTLCRPFVETEYLKTSRQGGPSDPSSFDDTDRYVSVQTWRPPVVTQLVAKLEKFDPFGDVSASAGAAASSNANGTASRATANRRTGSSPRRGGSVRRESAFDRASAATLALGCLCDVLRAPRSSRRVEPFRSPAVASVDTRGASEMPVAMSTFSGFRPEAIQFLADLAANNERDWFQPRKAEFEQLLKQPMEELCVALEEQFRTRNIPLHADPVKSPFRIYRDTRFSKDKSPYKTHLAASFGWAGDGVDAAQGRSHSENVHASGGYFHLAPGEIYVGGGVWHPDAAWLTAFRDRVVEHYDELRDLVDEPAFREAFGTVSDDGESLKRVPPGYPADHPAADLLRKKNVTFGRRLGDDEALSPDLPVTLADAFATATPLMRYLATI